jgi:signal transduction histidine kinase
MTTRSTTEVNEHLGRGAGSRTGETPAAPLGRTAGNRQHGRVSLLKAPFQRRAWRELAYVWASLPLAVFGLLVVYGLVTPIVPLTWAFVPWLGRWVGSLYRGLARRVLGIDVGPPAPAPRPDRPGVLGWLFARIRDGAGWRAAGYALLRLPYAIVMVYLGAGFWFYGLLGMANPLVQWTDRQFFPSGERHFGVSINDTFVPSWIVVPVGLVLFFSAPWVVHGFVRLDTYLMSRLLGRRLLSERVRDLEETRAMAVDDAAATLRRIERDLHDGAQARLVALAMDLTMMRDRLREDSPDLIATRQLVDTAHAHAKEAIGELRDLARGIHPPVLDRGLAEALQTLAARSPVPVALTVDLPRRLAPAIETIAYYCASELLTNVARHSGAQRATVDLSERDGFVELRVGDDGAGGAGLSRGGGTGLAGLADRVRTVDGTLSVSSPVGGPTVVTVRLPVRL